MGKKNRLQRGAPPPGPSQPANRTGPAPANRAGIPTANRPGIQPLIPTDPLPGSKALMQAAILLGIPLTLLLVARLILRKFFPTLGY